MNHHDESVAADLGYGSADHRNYVYGNWVTYSDDWSRITLHGGQIGALIFAVVNNLHVVYLPHGVEIHKYTYQAITHDVKKEEGPT